MQTATREEVLEDVFSDVMESLAFMFAERVDKEDLPSADGTILAVGMRFAGPFAGTLALTVPEATCTELAANVMGMDPEDAAAEEHAADALREVLNVTCGQLLTALAGDEPVFDLSVPTAEQKPPAHWAAALEQPQTLAFLVDESPMLLTLSIDATAATGA